MSNRTGRFPTFADRIVSATADRIFALDLSDARHLLTAEAILLGATVALDAIDAPVLRAAS